MKNAVKIFIGCSFFISLCFPQTMHWAKSGKYVGSIRSCRFFVDNNGALIVYDRNGSNAKNKVHRSLDGGKNWKTIDTVVTERISGYVLMFDSTRSAAKIVATSFPPRSMDTAYNIPLWFISMRDSFRLDHNNSILYSNDGKIYSATNYLTVSPDSGKHWSVVDMWNAVPSRDFLSLNYADSIYEYFILQGIQYVVSDRNNNIVASSTTHGIFVSRNNGRSWAKENVGISDTSITALTIGNQFEIFALSKSGLIFKGTVYHSYHKR